MGTTIASAGIAMEARDAVLALLAARAPAATVCPSEVARALARDGDATGDWRGMMPAVHAAIDALSSEGRVRLSWKGRALAGRAGPYRIAHGAPLPDR